LGSVPNEEDDRSSFTDNVSISFIDERVARDTVVRAMKLNLCMPIVQGAGLRSFLDKTLRNLEIRCHVRAGNIIIG
jgi:hypothetical protein